MRPQDQQDFPLLWRGDWGQYSEMYMKEISKKYKLAKKEKKSKA